MRYIAIFLLVVLISCELVVDVDIPIEKRKITVNSFFTTDSLWSARLTLSRHILDDFPFKPVEDGLVVMYQDGHAIDTLINQGSGLYQSDTGKPLKGIEYEIKVESVKYGTAISKSSAPFPVSMSSWDVSIPTRITGSELATINIHFQDPAQQENFYEVHLIDQRKYIRYKEDTVFYYNSVPIFSNDPIFDVTHDEIESSMIFNDVLFDGKTKSIEFKCHSYFLSQNSKFWVHFKTLSRDVYQYKTTSSLQQHVSNDLFAQPVKVYTNIAGGFGIFGGYSEQVYEYKK